MNKIISKSLVALLVIISVVSSTPSYVSIQSFATPKCGNEIATIYALTNTCFQGMYHTCNATSITRTYYYDSDCTGGVFSSSTYPTKTCSIDTDINIVGSLVFDCVDEYVQPKGSITTINYNGTCADKWQDSEVFYLENILTNTCIPIAGDPLSSYQLTCDSQATYQYIKYHGGDATCNGESNSMTERFQPYCGAFVSTQYSCNQ